MGNLSTIPGYAIVEILKEDHDRKFFKEVKVGKETRMLSISLQAAGIYDEHFSQGVSLARVVSRGDGVDWIGDGDTVVIDYTVDTKGGKLISDENGVKLVRANAVNEYYTDTKLIPQDVFSRSDTYDHKPGDLKSAATIFGVVKDHEIIPNYPYVFLKYTKLGDYEVGPNGLIVPSSNRDIVIREVLFTHPDSPMKPGDKVMVDFYGLYEREVGGELISIAMHDDIYAVFDDNK